MRLTVGKLALSFQVGERLFAIPHNMERDGFRRLPGGDQEQFYIVRAIFDHQDIP